MKRSASDGPEIDLGALAERTTRLGTAQMTAWASWFEGLSDEARVQLAELQAMGAACAALVSPQDRGELWSDDPVRVLDAFGLALNHVRASARAILWSTRREQIPAPNASPSPDGALADMARQLESVCLLADSIRSHPELRMGMVDALFETTLSILESNPFFFPTNAMEFVPYIDRLDDMQAQRAMVELHAPEAQTVLGLTLLSLRRLRNYVSFAVRCADASGEEITVHALTTLMRRNARIMAKFLLTQGMESLSAGYTQQVLSIHADKILETRQTIDESAKDLRRLRTGVEHFVSSLQTDMTSLLHALDVTTHTPDWKAAFLQLEQLLAHLETELCRTVLGTRDAARKEPSGLSDAYNAFEYRRDLWIFLHILRPFVSQLGAFQHATDDWRQQNIDASVRSFMGHFRRLGMPLLDRGSPYLKRSNFLSLLEDVRRAEYVGRPLAQALTEASQDLCAHLQNEYNACDRELVDRPFDKMAAAEELRTYLEATKKNSRVRASRAAAAAFGIITQKS